MRRTEPLPGIEALCTPTISLNGASKTADYMYYGGDALAAGTWADRSGNGNTLTLANNGAGNFAMTYQQAGRFSKTRLDPVAVPGTTSVARWQTAGQIAGQIGADDFVLEIVIRTYTMAAANYDCWLSNWDAVNLAGGIQLMQQAGIKGVNLYLVDEVTKATAYARFDPPEDSWQHVVYAMNRDGGASSDDYPVFANGVKQTIAGSGTPAAYAGYVVTPTAGKVAMLGYPDGYRTDRSILGPYTIAYAAQWHGADWLASGASLVAEMRNFARERFAAITGGTMTFSSVR